MSKQNLINYIENVPRWALVLLALYGVISLKDLHAQIKADHATISQHSADINELKQIAQKITKLLEKADKL